MNGFGFCFLGCSKLLSPGSVFPSALAKWIILQIKVKGKKDFKYKGHRNSYTALNFNRKEICKICHPQK